MENRLEDLIVKLIEEDRKKWIFSGDEIKRLLKNLMGAIISIILFAIISAIIINYRNKAINGKGNESKEYKVCKSDYCVRLKDSARNYA